MGPGRVRRALTTVLLISLTVAIFHIYLMQKRVSHLEHRFSQLYTADEEVGKDPLVWETAQQPARLNHLSHGRTQSVQRAQQVQAERENRSADSIKHENRKADSIEHEHRSADSIDHEHRRADSIEHENRRADSMESKSAQDVIQAASKHTQQVNQSVQHRLETDKGFEAVVFTNPHPYSFVINNPAKCENQDVFLLIMVTSLAENRRQRTDIRHTWGKESNVPGVGIKTVFAVGKPGNSNHQRPLKEENDVYRDIIQEDFDDTRRNSTLKTIMCLRWASQFCGNAEFVLKAEDDTFVNLIPFINHLRDLQNKKTTRLLMGYTYSGTKPLRDPFFIPKWYVSEEEYARDMYPIYPGGFAYVISNDVIRPLYEVSFTVKYLFLEDVYLGLCAEKLGIQPTHHNGFYPIFVNVNYCGLDWLLAARGVSEPGLMAKFWLIINACRKIHQQR